MNTRGNLLAGLVSLSLVALLALTGVIALVAPARPAAAARVKPVRVGNVSGRVNVAAADAANLRFQIDGVARRARLRGSTFLIAGVAVGKHTLSVLSGGSRGAHVRVSVRAKATTRVGTLDLAPGGQIAGLVSKVTDPGTGALQPLANVQVVADSIAPVPLRPGPAAEPLHLVAMTDDTGAYAFRAVPPNPYRVSVVVLGLEAGVESVFVSVGRTAVADFQLEEAVEPGVGSLQGTVSDPDGKPISGALVQAFPPGVYRPKAAIGAGRRPASTDPKKLQRTDFSTLTDEHGHYELNLPAGHLQLSVSADGFQPAGQALTLHAKQTLTIDVTLQPEPPAPTGVIEGNVFDAASGKPIRGAQVGLFFVRDPPGTEPNDPTVPPAGFVTFTDDQGFYRLDGVPAGTWPMSASADGYAPDTEKVSVTDGTTTHLDFKLAVAPPPPPLAAVEGDVYDADTGKPLQGALVRVSLPVLDPRKPPSPSTPNTPIMNRWFAITDEKGHYRIGDVPPGTWPVSASLAGYQPAEQKVEFTGGNTARASFKLARGGT